MKVENQIQFTDLKVFNYVIIYRSQGDSQNAKDDLPTIQTYTAKIAIENLNKVMDNFKDLKFYKRRKRWLA